MKRIRSVARPVETSKPVQALTLSDEKENKQPDESLNLSPERVMEGASATTALLNQILAQREGLHQLRDWGINE